MQRVTRAGVTIPSARRSPPRFATDELAFYESEMAFLTDLDKSVDLAFLAIPDAGVEAAEAYLRVALRHLEPKAVALHPPPLQFGILPQAAELLRELGFEGEIHFPEHPGDSFQVGRDD